MDHYFSRNAAIVRANFPLSFEFDRPSLTFREFSIQIFESFMALSLLVVASPVILAAIALIKATSRGPAVYRQERVGKNGKAFTIYKLRTMGCDAEKSTGPVLSWKADPRVTPVGNFLRATHLDELPQLWNVVLGEMALVGPRPERPFFVNQFRREIPNYRLREQVKPGITGLAQVCCGYNAAPEEKLEFDLVYIQHRYSLAMNVLIFFYTAKKVVFARSA